ELPAHSVFVNLASVRCPDRSRFTAELFERIEASSARRGRPHVIVLDCTESVVNERVVASLRRMQTAMRVLVIERPEQLPHEALSAIDVVLALGDSAVRTISALGGTTPALDASIEPGQAIAWFRDSGTTPFRLMLQHPIDT